MVRFKDESLKWVKLKDTKDSNPIKAAEHAVANQLVEELAFKWWVPQVLQKRNRIVKKGKSRCWKTIHRFGIKSPHSIKEALQIDKETRNDFWRWATNKEMAKVMVGKDKCLI